MYINNHILIVIYVNIYKNIPDYKNLNIIK